MGAFQLQRGRSNIQVYASDKAAATCGANCIYQIVRGQYVLQPSILTIGKVQKFKLRFQITFDFQYLRDMTVRSNQGVSLAFPYIYAKQKPCFVSHQAMLHFQMLPIHLLSQVHSYLLCSLFRSLSPSAPLPRL